MQREIVIVGLSHRSAPIHVREAVAVQSSYLRDALGHLRANPSIHESVILSTCNRVEVVATAADCDLALSAIKVFLREQGTQKHPDRLDEYVYSYRGALAVRHLFRVAAGLDSMVVGEPQILGQLKDYYRVAHESGTVATILHRLFHRSFAVAKRVRSETGIGSGAVSVSSVAVDLAKRIFQSFDDKTVILIGAGKMGDLMARHLQRSGVHDLIVTNRTFERAVQLAAKMQGRPMRFEDLPQCLKLADLVIGCASSAEILVDAAMVERALKERKHKAMFFIDIGDRRNFDGRLSDLKNVYLYNLDFLKDAAQENLQERSNEAIKAERIVQDEVQSFCRWIGSLEQVPTILALKQYVEEIRRKELEKFLDGGLRGLSPAQLNALEDMTSAMVNKLLHRPIAKLKRSSQNGDDDAAYVAALRNLFDLDSQKR